METKTFYELISNHVIEIPIIQREYAQGRTLPRVTTIRNRFVRDLVNCIRCKQQMHLGFVYGKIEGKNKQQRDQVNRDAVGAILEAVKAYANNLELKISAKLDEVKSEQIHQTQLKFIPLDGQQRLTTLYLLYWYLNLKGAKSTNKNWRYHFNYTNRKSTMDFLKEINSSKNIKVIRDRVSHKTSIKNVIIGSSFYLQKWEKDKTVLGMLEMLEAIENEFEKDFDFSEKNIENLDFRFDFMDLDALNQTNELYVKMNSRGKHLSNYEHFKSWLQEQYKTSDSNIWLSEFWRNLDNNWLNFFWRKIDADFSKLDDFYFNFFKNIALMHNIAKHPNIPFKSFKELIGLIRNSNTYDPKNISYIPFEKFYITWKETEVIEEGEKVIEIEKELFLFNKETLEFIESTFKTLQHIDGNKESYTFLDEVLCSPFLKNNITNFYLENKEFTPTQPDATFYYAFIAILNKRKDQTNQDLGIRDWLRFNRNLIYNTNIQNPENFHNALQQIGCLLECNVDFETKLLGGKIKNSFFDNSQFEEEVLKVKLINADNSWYSPIITTENQYYFQGQIKFIIDFSLEEKDKFNLSDFVKYSSVVSKLYSDKIRRSTNNVLQRVLLCEGDYMPYYKSNYLFPLGAAGGLRTRNENWRLFFKGNKVGLLKQLIDRLDVKDISEISLINYIQSYIENSNDDDWDWKYLFLKYPDVISYCEKGFIKWYSENDVRLLPKTNVGGYHSELRTYCFYLENRDLKQDGSTDLLNFLPFSEFKFFENKNSDGHPGCYLRKFKYKNKEYRLDVRYSKTVNKFEVCFYHNQQQIEDRNANKKIVDLVLNLDYQFDMNYNHYFKILDYGKAFQDIKILCEELKSISND